MLSKRTQLLIALGLIFTAQVLVLPPAQSLPKNDAANRSVARALAGKAAASAARSFADAPVPRPALEAQRQMTGQSQQQSELIKSQASSLAAKETVIKAADFVNALPPREALAAARAWRPQTTNSKALASAARETSRLSPEDFAQQVFEKIRALPDTPRNIKIKGMPKNSNYDNMTTLSDAISASDDELGVIDSLKKIYGSKLKPKDKQAALNKALSDPSVQGVLAKLELQKKSSLLPPDQTENFATRQKEITDLQATLATIPEGSTSISKNIESLQEQLNQDVTSAKINAAVKYLKENPTALDNIEAQTEKERTSYASLASTLRTLPVRLQRPKTSSSTGTADTESNPSGTALITAASDADLSDLNSLRSESVDLSKYDSPSSLKIPLLSSEMNTPDSKATMADDLSTLQKEAELNPPVRQDDTSIEQPIDYEPNPVEPQQEDPVSSETTPSPRPRPTIEIDEII
jgi:hypothetical protein